MAVGSILEESPDDIMRQDDITINHPIIDNNNYFYYMLAILNPEETDSYVAFYGAEIEYTIDTIGQ